MVVDVGCSCSVVVVVVRTGVVVSVDGVTEDMDVGPSG